MLVLTRHRGDSVVVGAEIVVQVLEIRGDKVRLGISAPEECRIFRRELLDSWSEETREDGTYLVGPHGSELGPFATEAEARALRGLSQAA